MSQSHTTTHEREGRATGFARIALAAATGLAAINLLGVGAFASWTDSEADQVAVTSGTLGIALGADGPDNRLSVDATNIAPGDIIQRAVTLTNDGSIDLSAIELTTSAANGSLLYTGVDRLDLRIKACDVPWTETAEASGGYSYTCTGAVSYPLGDATSYGDVQHSGTVLAPLASTTAGGVDHLVFDMQLPSTADNTYQGQLETITFVLDAAQRSGTYR